MTPRELQAKYPYQFPHEHRERYEFARGWLPRLVQLCAAIDAHLGENVRGFHFVQIKEKWGCGRFYWRTPEHAPLHMDIIGVGRFTIRASDEEPLATIGDLVAEAEAWTQGACIVCGEHGEIDRQHRYLIILCPKHKALRHADPEAFTALVWLGDDDDVPV